MEYIKTAKMAASNEDFLCGYYFDSGLTIFHSYRYGEHASEVVEKIAAGKKVYRKCSLCVIVCIATTYQYE